MKKATAILLTIVFLALGLFWGMEAWDAVRQHYVLLTKWINNSKTTYYPWYLWVIGGACVFPLMNKYFVKNIDMIKVFTHESAHMVLGMLLFRRIHSFHAEDSGNGAVSSSGNDRLLFVTVFAPYCFPVITFPLLMFRCLVAVEYMPIIDVIIGISIGIHIVCAKEQTRSDQPDIKRYPLWFSYTYIISALLFDISLILMSYLPDSNIFDALVRYAIDVWHLIF